MFLMFKFSTSVLKSAKMDQIDAHGAQHRAVIKKFCNYRPTTATVAKNRLRGAAPTGEDRTQAKPGTCYNQTQLCGCWVRQA